MIRRSRIWWRAAFIVALPVWLSAETHSPTRASIASGILGDRQEEQVDRWFYEAVDLIYQGRPSEALRIAEAMTALAPEDPRPYLLHTRILRLDVPDQNFERDDIKPSVVALDSLLEISISKSEKLLQKDENSVPGLLYRGWAYMFQSQLRALSNEYWGAGRKAKAGKRDLDRVLRLRPDLVDARFVLGTYLYFADILPGAVKIARFIVGIPGGDVNEGLSDMGFAADRNGYSSLDARALLGVVYFGFEGRYEDALAEFAVIERRFPHNARILEPTAVIHLLLPHHLGANLEGIARATRLNLSSPEAWVRNVAARLRLYESLALLHTGRVDVAQSYLQELLDNVPSQPDWLRSAVGLALADIRLLLGDADGAQVVAKRFEDENLQERFEYVSEPQAAAQETDLDVLLRLQHVARPLYDRDFMRAETQLAEFEDEAHVLVEFYRGELALLQRRFRDAIAAYEKLTKHDLAPRYRLFRFLAFVHQAHAWAEMDEIDEAKDLLGEALDFYKDPDLLRHATKARRRYFENDRPGYREERPSPPQTRRSSDG